MPKIRPIWETSGKLKLFIYIKSQSRFLHFTLALYCSGSVDVQHMFYHKVSINHPKWNKIKTSSLTKIHKNVDLSNCGVLCDLDEECNMFKVQQKNCFLTYVCWNNRDDLLKLNIQGSVCLPLLTGSGPKTYVYMEQSFHQEPGRFCYHLENIGSSHTITMI